MNQGADMNVILDIPREQTPSKKTKVGNAEHRQPNHFLLTFAYGRDSRAQPPTHDWRKIKTIEEAEA